MNRGVNSDNDQMLVAIRRIMRAIDLQSKQLARECGLTTPQLLILQAIAREGNPSPGVIARHVHLSQATVTNIVDRLEKGGLVTRERDEKDRRVIHLLLTEAGRERLDNAPEPLQAGFLRELGKLDDWERKMLVAAMLRVAEMMDANRLDASPILEAGELHDAAE